MSQQNGWGIYGILAFFMLATIICGVGWGLSASEQTALTTAKDQAARDKEKADSAVRTLTQERDTLLDLIGRPDAEVGQLGSGDDGTVAGSLGGQLSSPRFSDGTAAAASLEAAMNKAATDRDIQSVAAVSRNDDVLQRNADLAETVRNKDTEIQVAQEGRAKAEADLIAKENQHTEQLENINRELQNVKAALRESKSDFAALDNRTRREIENLQSDNREKRAALLRLRKELFEKDDVSFATADGVVSFVDQTQLLAYINLGNEDGLDVGTTFSVYTSSNAGIGRRNTDDIKGKIKVVGILGAHEAEVRITDQDTGRPIGKGDPIYSPIFTAGIPMEIAVAGLIDFDGSPGSDRRELLALITAHGAKVPVQVGDDGQFIDQNGETIGSDNARSRISERTRFLVLGDLGHSESASDSSDETRLKTYRRIQEHTGVLQRQAENHGVYEISLPIFLEFLGYSRKHSVHRSGQAFPARLANGARSQSVNQSIGNRTSSAVISPKYSSRRIPRLPSTGAVSKLFSR